MSITPSRLAVLTAVLSAASAFVASVLGAVDTTPKAVVVSVALVAGGGVLALFIRGGQLHEARQALATASEEVAGLSEGVKATGPVEGSDG